MCYLQNTAKRYKGCGDLVRIKRDKIDCNRTDCALSGLHNPEYHVCASTCSQT
ncbi:hypothetical protein BT96DRAFT_269615 [Gymnopus androsaceus JB14]|uniref:Uncharacterized protein n=1 Tax=Gymnopus androsaceus JB14 TaxID=1447944 RepID=A0A6A4I8W3_9AGAR|nr:hypothetical protein BT96DRAFT_269615 [Gymnopus androsaceus JB14]